MQDAGGVSLSDPYNGNLTVTAHGATATLVALLTLLAFSFRRLLRRKKVLLLVLVAIPLRSLNWMVGSIEIVITDPG